MRVGKFLLVKAFLIVAGILSANGVGDAKASALDGMARNTELSNVKLDGVKYAGCIFDTIIGAERFKNNNEDEKY